MKTSLPDPTAIEHLLGRLAPRGAGVAACEIDASLLEQLTATERRLVNSARPGRRAEFAAGRSCAHRALAAIGADVGTIGRGRRREPVWPTGATGSISHAAGLAAAVVACTEPSVVGIGVDLEFAHGLDRMLWPDVLTPSERLDCDVTEDPVATATSLFSAKEAAFKAVYPLLGVDIAALEANAAINAGIVDISMPGACVKVHSGRLGPLVVSVAVVATGDLTPS